MHGAEPAAPTYITSERRMFKTTLDIYTDVNEEFAKQTMSRFAGQIYLGWFSGGRFPVHLSFFFNP